MALEWTKNEAAVAEKWTWLEQSMDLLAKSRICFEQRCLREVDLVFEAEADDGFRFEAGFCSLHAEQATREGLGEGWTLGASRPLGPGEVLDGPARDEDDEESPR